MRRQNGTVSVYKLSGNRRKPYAARKTVGWDDKNHPKYEFLGFFKTKEEAEKALYEEYGSNVYFISDGEYIKIGKADDVKKRLNILQVGNPKTLQIIQVIECKDAETAYKLEHFLQKLFQSFNYKGEWFQIPKKEGD